MQLFPEISEFFYPPPVSAVEAILFPIECSGTEATKVYNNRQSDIKKKEVR